MARKKKRYPKQPPMKHLDKFVKYLDKKSKDKQHQEDMHCGFKRIDGMQLFRIDTMETVE